jgi:hypothetical protein
MSQEFLEAFPMLQGSMIWDTDAKCSIEDALWVLRSEQILWDTDPCFFSFG